MLHPLSLSTLLSGLLLLLACNSAQATDTVLPCQSNATLRISFLNVGQGDATLVSCLSENRHLLIDAGDSSARYPEAEALLRQALLARTTERKIDYAVTTHPHLDHVYGFLGLLKDNFKISEFIDNGEHGDIAQIYRDIKSAVISDGGQTSSITIGQQRTIELCNSLVVTLTSPTKALAPMLGCPANFNDCSLSTDITITTASKRQLRIAVLADKTYDWEKIALKNDILHTALVLRLGHHGNLSTSTALLEKIKPAFAVISAGQAIGENAAFGYPRLDTIENLNNYFAKYFDQDTPLKRMPACKWQNGKCHWLRSPLHERILDSRSGTIDIFVTDNNFCIKQ